VLGIISTSTNSNGVQLAIYNLKSSHSHVNLPSDWQVTRVP